MNLADDDYQQNSYPSKDSQPEMVELITASGDGGAGEPAPMTGQTETVDESRKLNVHDLNQYSPECNSHTVTYTFEGLNNMGELPCHGTIKSETGSKLVKELDANGVWCRRFYNLHYLLSAALVLLVILQMFIVGFWIRLFDLVRTSMPHTFSWFSILSCYGAVFDFKKCDRDPSHLCELEYSVPYIPIFGINLCSVQLIMTLLFLFFKSCRKPFLFYLKQIIFLQGLFVIFGGVVAVAFLYRDLAGLKQLMKREMLTQNHSQSERWQRTQLVNHCCGIDNVSDWILETRIEPKNRKEMIPTSCCVINSCDKLLMVNPPGCYNLEYKTVLFYGKIEILLLLSGFIMSIAVLLLSKRYYISCKKQKRLSEQATSHRIFIRQGSNYTVFSGQSGNGNTQIIRKNGILIEAKGVLASSTSINNDQLSLEILNFSLEDKITVTRESDRIIISVLKRNYMKGKAVLTAIDEENLRKIKITPTSTGILNITLC